MESENRSVFVQSRLPWLIFGIFLLLYLVTLNRWVSLSSLQAAVSISATDQAPPMTGPLTFLVTLPFRWLPTGWQLSGLNALAAVFGALTLGLLARSVALLPHDRTRDERQREQSEFSLLSISAAWAPPVFAALICGLQLSFWENSTAGTGEMLDLLLFAYVIRCLLEYRVGENDKWLYRLALVYGIAATNNYAMIGFFLPVVVAVVWIKGVGVFNFQFVARMVALGCAGMLLYLLLPLLNSLSASASESFWSAFKYQIGIQKAALLYPSLRTMVLVTALTSLLPILVIGIRWPSTFGDTSVVGAFLTQFVFHVVHGMFLAACLWVAFDAPFSGRSLMGRMLQRTDDPTSGVPFLTFYYLAALSVGYFIGYFLLIFGQQHGKARFRQSSGSLIPAKVLTAVIWVLIVLAPIGLFSRNLPVIRSSDGRLLREFAGLASERLQGDNRIGLSDQPHILSLVDVHTRQAESRSGVVLADTRLLPYPKYQKSLHNRHPKLWPEPPSFPVPMLQLSSLYLMQEVTDLSASNLVYYLHPSFGYYFESVYLEPAGLTYHVIPYPTNEVGAPPMSRAEFDANSTFWKRIEPQLGRVVQAVKTGANDARVLSRWYSRAVNVWGVELQKTGRLKEAEDLFALALKLNPQNFSAEINRAYNQTLQAGTTRTREGVRLPEDPFSSRYRSWDAVLTANGPIDEPTFCFQLAQTLVQQSLFRQAAIQLLRSLQLEPENLNARLWLANVYLLGHVPDKALETTRDIRARTRSAALQITNQVELVRIDAIARIQSDRFQDGEKLLLDARQKFPGERVIDDTLLQVYLQLNRITNALALIAQQLEQAPGNPDTLMNQALVYLRIPDYARAAATISQILKRDPENVRALIVSGTISVQTQAYPEALSVLDHALRVQPDNVEALLTKSAALIQTQDFAGALKTLDRAIKLQPGNQAVLLNHAIASLQSRRLADARRDYEKLQALLPLTHSVYFGLGEIAYQQKNFPEAIRNYEIYLKLAPSDTKEAREVAERLKQMKSGAL